MHEDNEDRLDAAEQLAEHNPRTAAEAFSAIACDPEVGDEVRLSAAERLAAVGPQAAVKAFSAIARDPEVGDEVRDAFSDHGDEVRRGRLLDLPAIARRKLEQAGVEEIHDCGLCTICSDASLFYSHRRDHGVTGRQAGIAWLS